MVVDNIIDPNMWNSVKEFLEDLQETDYIKDKQDGNKIQQVLNIMSVIRFRAEEDSVRPYMESLNDNEFEYDESDALESILY